MDKKIIHSATYFHFFNTLKRRNLIIIKYFCNLKHYVT